MVGVCIAWGIDNSVTARIDQLSPEQITFAKGAVAGTANLALGIAVASAWDVEIGQAAAALLIRRARLRRVHHPLGQGCT